MFIQLVAGTFSRVRKYWRSGRSENKTAERKNIELEKTSCASKTIMQ